LNSKDGPAMDGVSATKPIVGMTSECKAELSYERWRERCARPQPSGPVLVDTMMPRGRCIDEEGNHDASSALSVQAR
jgi:hypothetical protein